MMVRSFGKALPQHAVRVDHHLLLTRMSGGGSDNRPAADRGLDRGEPQHVDRRRRNVELQIAGQRHARRAELGVAFGILRRLRKAEIETLEQRRDGFRKTAPARVRALRQPPVDQDQRNVAGRALHDEIGPEVRFREERQVGPPVVEEAGDKARRVERHKLVDGAFGQSALGELRRGHGAGCDQHAKPTSPDALDQRHHRQHLADAGAMGPDERAARTHEIGLAAALRHPLRMLFAVAGAAIEHQARERRRRMRQAAIGAQARRQPLNHGQHSRMRRLKGTRRRGATPALRLHPPTTSACARDRSPGREADAGAR